MDWVPSIQHEMLQRAFRFTKEDLQANRTGVLSKRQRAELESRTRRIRITYALFGIAAVLLFYFFIPRLIQEYQQSYNLGSTIAITCIYGLPNLLALFFIVATLRTFRRLPWLRQSIREGTLTIYVVRITKQPPVIRRRWTQEEMTYPVKFNDQVYPFSKQHYDALTDADYVFYTLLTGGIPVAPFNILSLELASDFQQIYPTPISSPMQIIITDEMKPSLEQAPSNGDSGVLPSAAPIPQLVLSRQDADIVRKNEIFISYARADSAFVHELVAVLREQSIDPWIDLEDIPKTVKWWEAIKQGILEANAFVFVLSESALQSEVCHWELAYALENGKRIIPLEYVPVFKNRALLQAVDQLQWPNPEGGLVQAAHNWTQLKEINFVPAGETSTTTAREIMALARADFVYIEQHSRLLQQALDWQQANHADDLLLRGIQLNNALAWLRDSQGKSPASLPIHRGYIQTSQFAEEKRREEAALIQQRLDADRQTVEQTKSEAMQAAEKSALAEQRVKAMEKSNRAMPYLVGAFLIFVFFILIASTDDDDNQPFRLPTRSPVEFRSFEFPTVNPTFSTILRATSEANSLSAAFGTALARSPRTAPPPTPTDTAKHAVLGDNTAELAAVVQEWRFEPQASGVIEVMILARWEAVVEVRSNDELIASSTGATPLQLEAEVGETLLLNVSREDGIAEGAYILSISQVEPD